MALIELNNISRSYPSGEGSLTVLKNVTLTIEEGEFTAFMGPSGCGKSTLLQILGLLDSPSTGTYRLAGQDTVSLSEDEKSALRSSTIGFIFQMFNLLPRTTALNNVVLPMIYTGVPHREERAKDLLVQMGLSDRLTHRPNELSCGQQQRVAIARSLANNPRLLFADEPTGNLASDQAEDILKQLAALNQKGITLVMVTHAPEIAARASRVIRMKDGEIISDEKGRGSPVHRSFPPSPPPATGGFRRLARTLEYTRSALRAVASNKVRSGLSVLGILIGVASVIAMLAMGTGAQKAIESRLSGLGANLLLVMPGSPSQRGVRGVAGSASRLTLLDIKAIARSHPDIQRVDGNVSGGVQVVYQDKNANSQVTGALPLYEPMRAATPYAGRFFTDEENNTQERVALLGNTVVKKLFDKENPVGKRIKINRVNFQVIGVLPLKGSGGFRDQDDVILIPLKTAMNRVLGRDYLNNIAIECDNPDAMESVTDTVRDLLRKRHRLPDFKEDDFDIRNMADIKAALTSTTQTFSLLLGIVAAISLLVGGIGIMNIMLVSVSERTREIGLRKAVGASRHAILSQFLIEATVLSTFGGVMGIALGTAVSTTLSHLAGWASVVSMQSVTVAFLFSASVGVVFGFWPARKASLLSPIAALRYE